MNVMRVIARAGDWEVVQDANSNIHIQHGVGGWVCDHESAYEAIRDEVKDPAIRTELLRQWAKSMNGGGRHD